VTRRDTWGWLLTLFTLAGFVETIFWGQVSAFTPLYLPQLGVPESQVAGWTGAIASISGILGLPFLPFWGALADRFARKPIIIRSFVAHLLAGIICILARDVWVFLLGRTVMTLSLGNTGLMMTTLAERVPQRRQALAFSILNGAGPVGVFLGPLVGGPLVDRWGFRALLWINAALLLAVILFLAFGYRDSYQGTDRGPILKMAIDSVRIIVQSPRLRALFPALFLLFAGWVMALTFVPLIVAGLYPGSDQGTVVGLILGAGGFAALVLSPQFGILADRFGLWRVVLVGAAVEVFLWMVPALTTGLIAFGVAWALINGLASSVFSISFNLLARSASSEVRGRVMAFAYLPVNVGSIVGPGIGSLAARGSLFAVFPVAALLTALGVAMLFYARGQESDMSISPGDQISG
jgi:DHA1 family multidrug resistance protein-like MFS transporter